MSDQTLYRRQSCDCPQIGGPDCRAGYVPVTETLLTREEAANDPEVQRMVRAAKWPIGGDRR